MAKIKFSMMVSEMSGKLNGSVFARNRGGAYVRTKVTPVNPQTASQAKVRNRFGIFSQMWRAITEAQRKAWSAVTDQWQKTDVFGDLQNPSGNALFVRLNTNIAKVGGDMISNPPLPSGTAGANDLEFNSLTDATEVKIAAAFPDITADERILIEATPGMSPGISNAKNKFRIITHEDHDAVFPLDVTASYTEKFGEVQAGQKVFVRVSVVNKLTGEQSPRLSASGIVAAD